jgi:hypothetical protein
VDDVLLHFLDQLLDRTEGPLQGRFVLQPLVAVALAIRAGLRDARLHQPPYLWAVFTSRGERRALLQSAWKDIGKVFLMASLLDTIYQIAVVGWLYPRQALVIAFALAIVPYVIVRGPVARIAGLARVRRAGR